MLIVDESNLVKNFFAIRSQRITALANLCRYRVILNGTPVSKNEADLFSQWYILDWRVLGYRSFYSFAANHLEYDPDIPGKVRRVLDVDYLVRKIAPYSFQISRAECFPLPPKKYESVSCRMTAEQELHYDEVADRMLLAVDEMRPETIYRLFSALQAVISGRFVHEKNGHLFTVPMFAQPADNPRLMKLLDLLKGVGEEKAIIFCKYTHEIQSIASLLGSRAVTFYGGLPQRRRQENLDAFRTSAQFLLANKVCAGYGLNLQFCRRIIYYSNDWDYATRAQSEDRVHRFGQTSEVIITDLYAGGTLDERIIRCLDKKENLVNVIKRELKNSNGVRETLRGWIKGGKNGEDLYQPDRHGSVDGAAGLHP